MTDRDVLLRLVVYTVGFVVMCAVAGAGVRVFLLTAGMGG